MTDIKELWEYACNGNIEGLKKYYDDGGSINNRYFKFGEGHSLIMGAFRNNQFDTVEYFIGAHRNFYGVVAAIASTFLR